MKNLTPRELATVLAALRYWQDKCASSADPVTQVFIPAELATHFIEEPPLTMDDIDTLCEQLNFGDEDEPLITYAREEIGARFKMIAEGNDPELPPLTDEEKDDIWQRFQDGVNFDFIYEQLNDSMDDAIREVIEEREDA